MVQGDSTWIELGDDAPSGRTEAFSRGELFDRRAAPRTTTADKPGRAGWNRCCDARRARSKESGASCVHHGMARHYRDPRPLGHRNLLHRPRDIWQPSADQARQRRGSHRALSKLHARHVCRPVPQLTYGSRHGVAAEPHRASDEHRILLSSRRLACVWPCGYACWARVPQRSSVCALLIVGARLPLIEHCC